MKRAIIIISLLTVSGGLLFGSKKPGVPSRVECIVQSNQVVLNQYRDDDLYRSQSVSGNNVKKGQLKPAVRTHSSLQLVHFMTLGERNDQVVGLIGHRSQIVFYGMLPQLCIKALEASVNSKVSYLAF